MLGLWWGQDITPLSELLAFCESNPPVTTSKNYHVKILYFLRCYTHMLLNKQSNFRSFETSLRSCDITVMIQYIPRNMHAVFALLCFVVVIHWLISPYPSGLLHWHCGNLTIAPVPAKQPWWIWINTSCEFIMNDCVTTTKQSTTKPCAYFLGYTVSITDGNCQFQRQMVSSEMLHVGKIWLASVTVRTFLHYYTIIISK